LKPAIEGGTPVRKSMPPIGPTIEDDDVEAVVNALKSRILSSIHGSFTREFEKEFAKYVGVKYAVAVSNGTTALHIALKACGVGPGDEVIVPSFTFVATATAVLHANAIPVFADIKTDDYTIDVSSVKKKITPRTKAIIAVHLFGHPADIKPLKEIAEEHGICLIEDSAQAIGAEYYGRKTGSLADIGVFSFYPTKNITSGEGGMITTNNEDYAEKARLLRSHGQTGYYYFEELGYNFRMTEMQAALGLSQLRKIEKFNSTRREYAKRYLKGLQPIADIIKLPVEKEYAKSSWSLFEIQVDFSKLRIGRDELVKAIRAENVPVSIVYPRVVYENPVFAKLKGHGKGCPWRCPLYSGSVEYRRGITPNAEEVAAKCLTLHTDPIMGIEGVEDTIEALIKVIEYYRR